MKRIVRLRSVKDFKKVLLVRSVLRSLLPSSPLTPRQPKQTHPSEQPEPATAGDDIHRLQTQLEDISAKLVELKISANVVRETGGIN
ncbi:hypothetical protein E3P99_03443 [Wallemia hederae]|uniref:Uncharacterized protein n=1 Tax=Wallemia hederae TaxID=1540922 RepID=A0A4T0FFF6_9BASI|nr:hypothetical protein E3P99_03443 [Wallemia hederae]